MATLGAPGNECGGSEERLFCPCSRGGGSVQGPPGAGAGSPVADVPAAVTALPALGPALAASLSLQDGGWPGPASQGLPRRYRSL